MSPPTIVVSAELTSIIMSILPYENLVPNLEGSSPVAMAPLPYIFLAISISVANMLMPFEELKQLIPDL